MHFFESQASQFIMIKPTEKTVLIVNDSAEQREMMQVIFQEAGCRVLTASDGREAFQFAKNTRLDLIISDVIMPDGDGIELCQWIRSDEQLCSLPILLFSGLRKDSNHIVEGLEVGADDYLELPIDPLQLVARAERLIERKRMEDVLRESENYFRSLIENISDIITILSIDGTILYESPSVKPILGFQPGELIGKNAFEFVHTDDFEKVVTYFKSDCERTGKPVRIEYRFKHKSDSWRILESIGKIIEDPSRGTVIIITSRDITERRQSEKDFSESKAQLQTIFDNAAIGIALVNAKGIPIQTNPALQQMLGYTGEELGQMRFSDFTHPDDIAKDIALTQEVFEGKRDHFQIEKKYIKKGGEVMWGSLTVSVISGDGGKPLFVVGMVENITERKLAESALEQSERDYRTVFEQAHDAIMILAPGDETILDVNWRACALYGFSRAEFIGMSLETISKNPEYGKGKIKETLELGEALNFETIQYRKDGTEMVLEINGSKVLFKGQEAIISINRDITERNRAEKDLRESEENFRSLILATTQYVWTMKENGDGDLGHWWRDFTGQTFVETHGVGWVDAVHPEDREKVSRTWQNAVANKILFDAEYRVRAKTGEYHHFAVRGVPVFNADGSFRQWIGTFNDISELKQAEEALSRSDEQLRQSQKLESVGRLAGGIAHDFNNMLTAINGYSELTLRKLDAESPLRRNIEEIKKAGERSAMLTHQLLAFSRKQVLQLSILDLNEVITDTTKLLERVIGEDVRLETRLGAKGHIQGDAGQLSQIIMNLAVNARDAMPHGGKLTIETANIILDEEFAASHFPTKTGAYLMLSVTDNGMGMESETQKMIFEPFYTTKVAGKGTGLGLATVYGIVKQSGGFIWVDSEIGAGSTFSIYLPWIDAEIESRNPVKAVEDSPKAAAVILVVDDEDIVRTMTRQTLEECGYQVFEADSGKAALTICRQMNYQIDLVITDVMMPEMNGRELVEKLAELCPKLRVLFTSGYTNNAELLPDSIGKNNFIQKPFTFDALARQVRESLVREN